jgi:peroxiredoxin
MTIAVGDTLPDARFIVPGEDGLEEKWTKDIFSGRKIALFAVPGAFTPTCSNAHLPGFLENLEAFRARGVDDVVCVAVNDGHVMKAWAMATGAEGGITFLADGNADFTRAVGLDIDRSGSNMGTRSQRYAMLVDDGVVKALHIEDAPSGAVTSSAENLLKVI